ncbi:MAG: PKD domain-containing protein [Chitinophagales bacterium]|nr:PKD domain-containing protein [Chitinophagales bacterium]
MKSTTYLFTLLLLCALATFTGCNKDDNKKLPTACFTTITDTVTVGTPITFNNCSVNGTTYSWNFGDGQISTLADPAHVYTAVGTYTVTLTATNADGPATKTAVVTVKGCAPGYEGSTCTTEIRAKYFGTYLLAGTDNNTPANTYTNLSTTVSTSPTGVQNLVIIIDATITLQVKLNADNTSFTIVGPTTGAYTDTGSGSFTGSNLTINLIETETSSSTVTVYNLTGPKQ